MTPQNQDVRNLDNHKEVAAFPTKTNECMENGSSSSLIPISCIVDHSQSHPQQHQDPQEQESQNLYHEATNASLSLSRSPSTLSRKEEDVTEEENVKPLQSSGWWCHKPYHPQYYYDYQWVVLPGMALLFLMMMILVVVRVTAPGLVRQQRGALPTSTDTPRPIPSIHTPPTQASSTKPTTTSTPPTNLGSMERLTTRPPNNDINTATTHSLVGTTAHPTSVDIIHRRPTLPPSFPSSLANSTNTTTTKHNVPQPLSSPSAYTTTFYVIGDVPYNAQQSRELAAQIQALNERHSSPSSSFTTAHFVVHVGDLRSGDDETKPCRRSEYMSVAQILSRSILPVFVLPGDNDWNDCPNVRTAWQYWTEAFERFEARRFETTLSLTTSHSWNSTNHSSTTRSPARAMRRLASAAAPTLSVAWNVIRMPGRPETFSFTRHEVLFVGLNLVGGRVHNFLEWQTRLTQQFQWLRFLMRRHGNRPVVLLGHVDPVHRMHPYHDNFFFGPLRVFLRDEWKHGGSLLYINGDRHRWAFNTAFYGQSHWQRIMVAGGTSEPPLKVQVRNGSTPAQAFFYDREL